MHASSGRFGLAVGVVCLAVTAAALPPARGKPDGPSIPATGKASPALASFDRMMTRFLRERNLPGAAVAVGRNGKVVYARGFGYADREMNHPMQPEALFRIASISKPITATAVLQLVERGKLKLDAKVFDLLALKPPKKGFDARWRQVTVRHLLTHRGGWDRGASFDPMFRSEIIVKELGVAPPAMPGAIIQYMLGEPLDFDPGSKEAYSNFGYCLLGRVVEKASGQGYEEYVKEHVLAPLGVKAMRIGHTLKPAAGEVHYHESGKGRAVMGPLLGKRVPWPYGAWCLEAMDSHGGWIASAPDLVRFAMAFDNVGRVRADFGHRIDLARAEHGHRIDLARAEHGHRIDLARAEHGHRIDLARAEHGLGPAKCKILNPASIQRMFAPPTAAEGKKDVYYAMGWMVRPNQCDGKPNTWHNGSLDGTSTLLVRRCDGLTWAVLFNSSKKTKKAAPAGAIDGLMHRAANEVKKWPSQAAVR